MPQVTGLFTFKMKAGGEERPVTVEIAEPGLPSERVVQLVRGEWANLCAPRLSQNRIECLGWEPASAVPEAMAPVKARGAYPMKFWPVATR